MARMRVETVGRVARAWALRSGVVVLTAVGACAGPGGGGSGGANCLQFPTAPVCLGREVAGGEVAGEVTGAPEDSVGTSAEEIGSGETEPEGETTVAPEPDTVPDTTPDTESETVAETTPETVAETVAETTQDTTVTDTQTDSDTAETCDVRGFTSVTTNTFEGDTAGSIYTAKPSDMSVYLQIGFYAPIDGSGAPSPLTGPGTYPLGSNADDRNYRTCTRCVVAGRDCDATTGACGKWFFATSGAVEVTSLDFTSGLFVGALNGAELVEVTIDWEGDFTSTVVAGGEGWCIDHLALSAP